MTKGIIFYSDNRIGEPIKSLVWNSVVASGLPITTSYLQPGEKRSYPQMVRQIISCLERSESKYVFFCEADVIYPKSHFEFIPPTDTIFYYNENLWRWDYPKDRYITYNRLICLSGMCANRLLALEHYKNRQSHFPDNATGEANWVRKMGYEPGTKKRRRGGLTDDDFETWRSAEPIIDIRHGNTFSPRKVNLKDFKHAPVNWREQNEKP